MRAPEHFRSAWCAWGNLESSALVLNRILANKGLSSDIPNRSIGRPTDAGMSLQFLKNGECRRRFRTDGSKGRGQVAQNMDLFILDLASFNQCWNRDSSLLPLTFDDLGHHQTHVGI